MDRIEKIKKLQKQGYKRDRPQSMVINNFYTMATIVTISIAISLYTSYIAPTHIENNRKELQEKIAKEIELEKKKEQEYLEMRRKQIELAHKLNAKDYNDTNNK